MSIAAREELDRIKSSLESIVSRGFKAVEEAIALLEGRRDPASALDSIEKCMEYIEDAREELVRRALVYIARFQPVGYDLKLVHSIIDVSYDVFRISRYCREIAFLVNIAGITSSEVAAECLEALKTAYVMFKDAVKSLWAIDVALARSVLERDESIDEAYRNVLASLKNQSEPITREFVVKALLLRHVERIADHATYIARRVLSLSP